MNMKNVTPTTAFVPSLPRSVVIALPKLGSGATVGALAAVVELLEQEQDLGLADGELLHGDVRLHRFTLRLTSYVLAFH